MRASGKGGAALFGNDVFAKLATVIGKANVMATPYIQSSCSVQRLTNIE